MTTATSTAPPGHTPDEPEPILSGRKTGAQIRQFEKGRQVPSPTPARLSRLVNRGGVST